ncbi:caffeoylshikimate esterase-like [Impatiens glandulifera]|uniref:caffeoylshikimate esterase-like n=1 Tax=Impatiens glandulifera TaxID=253017 RepID=UPI001FB144E2|nr:caffeoylshikimate esterase-like [Impatiens glandulifera]
MVLKITHPGHDANETSPFGSFTADEFYDRHAVSHGSEFIVNARGMRLFTQWWIPLPPTKVIGCIAMIHGYTGETNWGFQLTAILFAKHGFAVCGIDHQGHGYSDGLPTHIPDVNPVVDDCVYFFDMFRRRHVPTHLPSFLYGESLGGAIALLISLRQRKGLIERPYNGMVLNGAMCGIMDKPTGARKHLIAAAAWLIPTWRIVPVRGSIVDLSVKVEWKRKLALANPKQSVKRPRAGTAAELLRICEELQSKFEEIDVPFFIVHGGRDIVCDPKKAEEFYERASSVDKTIRVYPEMLHQILGEPEESVSMVFGEIIEWLLTRSADKVAAV